MHLAARLSAHALVAALLWVASTPAALAQRGDPQAGLAYSRQHCGGCHSVEQGRSSPVAAAPTFEKIANMPGMNLMAFDVWMRTGHPTMPMLKLDASQTEDVSAWLQVLKRKD